MASRWPIKTLSEAGVQLLDCDHRTPKTVGVGRPYVTIPQLVDGRIDLPAARRISEDDFREWTKKTNPQANDVVVVRRCNSGDSAFVPAGVQFALGQNLVLLRSDGRHVRPEFLRWLARGPAWWEQVRKFINVGAVFDSLKCADIPNFKFEIPPVGEQAAISALLGALDDKIDLNRRMNETLEAMAQALFRSWFVDFDPVRAKADGRAAAGMDLATAALFPERLEPSEIGEVPRGWRVASLPDIIEVNPARSIKKGEVAPYLDMKNIPTAGHLAIEWELRPHGSGARFANGDTLLARITPCLENGKTAFVDFMEPGQIGWGSTEYIVLRPKPPLPAFFAYLLARSEGLRAHAIQSMTGTTGRQRVPASALGHFRMAVPPVDVAAAFDRATAPLIELARSNDRESRTLRELRDLLLPKLLSGELRVRDADRIVDRAV